KRAEGGCSRTAAFCLLPDDRSAKPPTPREADGYEAEAENGKGPRLRHGRRRQRRLSLKPRERQELVRRNKAEPVQQLFGEVGGETGKEVAAQRPAGAPQIQAGA